MNLRIPRYSALSSGSMMRTQNVCAALTQHPRRLLIPLVFISVFVTFTVFHLPSASSPSSSAPYNTERPPPVNDHSKTTSGGDGWQFVASLDERNYGLTEAQCDAAFPNYWQEIDRAVAFRKQHAGKVTEDDVDIGWRDDGVVRALIYNHQLYIIEAKGVNERDYHFRSLGILHQIHRALAASTEYIPNIEFSFSVDDMADQEGNAATIWTFSRLAHHEKQWLMPDYNYWSWPMDVVGDYSEVRTKIRDLEYGLGHGAPNPNPKEHSAAILPESPPQASETSDASNPGATSAADGGSDSSDSSDSAPALSPRALLSALDDDSVSVALESRDFFRSSPTGDASFDAKLPLLIWRGANLNEVRDALIRITTPNPPWADVQELVWSNGTQLTARIITMPSHCRYRFVVHTEGRSYSGRLKYLQNCHSVPILHRWAWIEPHHHLFVPEGPDQNFVLVERDFADLEPKLQALLANPREAKRIADNSVRDFRDRYLTPAAQACYWRKLFRGWASVQGFEPSLYVDGDRGGAWRALTYESYVLRHNLDMSRVGWSEEEVQREKERWDAIRAGIREANNAERRDAAQSGR